MVVMEEFASNWRPEIGRPSPDDELFVSYFSDHPGTSVRRGDAVSAIDDLRLPTWYLPPIRDALAPGLRRFTAPARAAVEAALAEVQTSGFLPAAAGDPCPRGGRWILRGTNHAIDIEAGQRLPRYAFYPESVHPPQWCRWDLPLKA